MAFKVLFIVRAPGSDPATDRSFLKTGNIEVTTIAFDPSDQEGISNTCVKLSEEGNLHAIVLCPAVSNELVADLSKKLGDKVAIFAGRGDFRSTGLAMEITSREWAEK